ncbi:MAG: 3-hydroxyacyl-CoA dehydrogenase family protein [Bacteroidota bacterium]
MSNLLNKPRYKIGIIGEGKMGTNLFYYLIDYNYPLVWVCSQEADEEKLTQTFHKKLKRSLKNKIINKSTHDQKIKSAVISKNLQSLAGCNIIIEAINEDQKQKIDLFKELNSIITENCILSSNTSSIPLSKLAQVIERKDKFVGLHFFYPIAFKNIVEVNTTSNTSPETIENVKEFLSSVKRTSLVLPEKANFILNRLFLDFHVEACRILDEKVLNIKEIDDLVKENIFPIGIFEFFDYVGNDLILFSVINYTKKSDRQDFYQPFINKLKQLVAENKLGIKTKCGFYNYKKNEESLHISKKDITNIDEYKKRIINKLLLLYLDSSFDIVLKGYCGPDEIEYAVKEYMGCEKGPVSLANEIGYKKSKLYSLDILRT